MWLDCLLLSGAPGHLSGPSNGHAELAFQKANKTRAERCGDKVTDLQSVTSQVSQGWLRIEIMQTAWSSWGHCVMNRPIGIHFVYFNNALSLMIVRASCQ